jgi:amidase
MPPRRHDRIAVCYTRRMQTVSVEQSGAFIEKFSLPATADGPLAGLRFAVKDLVDVAGHSTGCGNPTWHSTHPAAIVHAVCVEQLLAAGATCEGKTITDELAFSLVGENFHYGTPLNPAAPDRVPGGSSSGSASAVACGLVDFAIGTDTGGSVRVPASNCGIWGWRPTHGVVSVAGVMPLAPTYDTVGLLARDSEILERAAGALLAGPPPAEPIPNRIHFVREAFELVDNEVRLALEAAQALLKRKFSHASMESSLAELCGNAAASDLSAWGDTYRNLMAAEAGSCFASWLKAERPSLGPRAEAGFKFVDSIDRRQIGDTIARRENYCRGLKQAMGPRDLLCVPTTAKIAPQKGAFGTDRNSEYYKHTLALNAIAGVGRLPQISMPLAKVQSVPMGISFIGAHGEDAFVLAIARAVAAEV